jgi:integrase
MDRPLAPPEVTERLRQYFAVLATGPSTSSDLALLAERFIELKQHLGQPYDASARHLRGFLRFAEAIGVRAPTDLSAEVMLAWAASRRDLLPSSWMTHLKAVSAFQDHLKALGAIPTNLCAFLRRRTPSNFRPYIFSLEELKRIFEPARTRNPEGDRALVYFVIYACGLRASEATHLRIRDFDGGQGTLFIEKGKFGKDRLLPLHRHVIDRVQSFQDECRVGAPPESPLFPQPNGRPYHPRQLSVFFRVHLVGLGLYRATREVQGLRCGSTRLHSLRHSFAVHRLLRWYREGAEVQSKLPLLSTYLGHSNIQHTQLYLNATGLLLREGHTRFARHWEREFPLSP